MKKRSSKLGEKSNTIDQDLVILTSQLSRNGTRSGEHALNNQHTFRKKGKCGRRARARREMLSSVKPYIFRSPLQWSWSFV